MENKDLIMAQKYTLFCFPKNFNLFSAFKYLVLFSILCIPAYASVEKEGRIAIFNVVKFPVSTYLC